MKKKTPKAITPNLFGGFSVDKVWVWDFKDDNKNGPLVKKHLPVIHCYVKDNLQEMPEDNLAHKHIRKISINVYNQCAANLKKHGKFATNYKLEREKEYVVNGLVNF